MVLGELKTIFGFLLLFCINQVYADSSGECYGAGFVATWIVLAVIIIVLIGVSVYFWKKSRPKTGHLILETDPEKGKSEYALDNPGFTDPCGPPISKHFDQNSKNEMTKSEKQNCRLPQPQSFTTNGGPKQTVDDSVIDGNDVVIVALRSQDFAGLGFNICGNMKEGIFIKDILQRGPASESGKLNPGDRIKSVKINFDHIVFEDALKILSYASPYEVFIETKRGKMEFESYSNNNYPNHPIFRSSSTINIQQVENTNHPQKTINNVDVSTLEKEVMRSLDSNRIHSKMMKEENPSSQTILNLKDDNNMTNMETQKSENNAQKFGVKVYPVSQVQQTDERNLNVQKSTALTDLDATDAIDGHSEPFHRNGSLRDSNIRRDSNGIPQEIPSHMFNAAVAARRNRKNVEEPSSNDELTKTPKKNKGKAPLPPPEDRGSEKLETNSNQSELDDVKQDNESKLSHDVEVLSETMSSSKRNSLKEYSSDSDEGVDNHSSVNTIELNSSDITVHQGEDDEKVNRRTASTGDLTKINKIKKPNSGGLERAQSLDITDSATPTIIQKSETDLKENSFIVKSDNDLFGHDILYKDPRLSFILDSLNTFQRKRLKKSTEWGNLEDAIMRSSRDQNQSQPSSTEKLNFSLDDRVPEFDALVNKIDEMRRESLESNEIDISEQSKKSGSSDLKTVDSIKNQIWPTDLDKPVLLELGAPVQIKPTPKEEPKSLNNTQKPKVCNNRNKIWPTEIEYGENQSNKMQVNGKEIEKIPLDQFEVKNQESVNLNPSFFVDNQYENGVIRIETPLTATIENNHRTTNTIEGDLTTKLLVETPEYMAEERANNDIKKIASVLAEKSQTHSNLFDSKEEEHSNSIYSEEKIEDFKITLCSDEDETEVVPDRVFESSNKMKICKRQQLPLGKNDIILPPSDTEIETLHESFEMEKTIGIPGTSDDKMINRTRTDNMNKRIFDNIEPYSNTKKYFETYESTGEMNSPTEVSISNLNILNVKNVNDTENFMRKEREFSSEDTNISDDIKVSRHSFGTLEKPKSDDAKSIESMKYSSNVSNITISNYQDNGLHSLEFSVNDPSEDRDSSILSDSELYKTAMNNTMRDDRETTRVIITTPDLIKNVTLAEAISASDQNNYDGYNLADKNNERHSITLNNYLSNGGIYETDSNKTSSLDISEGNKSDSTYITEIQVTPNNSLTNKSEIEITPTAEIDESQNFNTKFEKFLQNAEVRDGNNLTQNSENETRKQTISSHIDPEKELLKIQEIAQEQLKKLPEMRFSTRSYESPTREKSQSQIELLRSNFERSSPTKSPSPKTDNVTKSRIPISTTMKVVPTSPERTDYRNLNSETEKETTEHTSSFAHSTPMNFMKYQKNPNKNITITSIRNNSKIPSGLSFSSSTKPQISSRKFDQNVETVVPDNNSNSFKQWVFESNTSANN